MLIVSLFDFHFKMFPIPACSYSWSLSLIDVSGLQLVWLYGLCDRAEEMEISSKEEQEPS